MQYTKYDIDTLQFKAVYVEFGGVRGASRGASPPSTSIKPCSFLITIKAYIMTIIINTHP